MVLVLLKAILTYLLEQIRDIVYWWTMLCINHPSFHTLSCIVIRVVTLLCC